MPTSSKILISLLVINLIFLNIGFAFLYFKPVSKETSTLFISQPSPSPFPVPISTSIPTQIPSPTLVHKNTLAPVSKTVSYIPIPGSGSLFSYTWGDIPGTDFYFDTTDFPGLKEGYFEANMKLFNGNGFAFLRLFDVTAGIELWGSEVKTSSQAGTVVVSDKLIFRSGKHLLRVQAKSLTADTTVFISGRLKIITEK